MLRARRHLFERVSSRRRKRPRLGHRFEELASQDENRTEAVKPDWERTECNSIN
jgi:hypothetical protein